MVAKDMHQLTPSRTEIRQPPFNTSLMGVIRGAADHHGIDLSTPMLYGASGHAFLINVHDQLCPSGPYVWNRRPFYRLLRILGLAVRDLGMIHDGSPIGERDALESKVKACLDAGIPCGCCNLDNQIVIGHDDEGFDLTMPWSHDPGTNVLAETYGSIAKKLDKVADRKMPADEKVALLESSAAQEAKAAEEIAALTQSLG